MRIFSLLFTLIVASFGVAFSMRPAAGNSPSFRIVAEVGDPTPAGNVNFRTFNEYPVLNNRGDVFFGAYYGVGSTSGVFRGESNGAIASLALSDQVVPGGNGAIQSLYDAPWMNQVGQSAVRSYLWGTSGKALDNSGIYRADPGSAALVEIAREGALVPGGSARLSDLGYPRINDAGQVAYRADLIGVTGGSTQGRGIFRSDGVTSLKVMRTGDAAPNGDGALVGLGEPVIDGFGRVTTVASVSAGAGTQQIQAVIRGDGATLATLAKGGQSPPEGNGRFTSFTGLQVNNGGQVAMVASLADVANVGREVRAIYLSGDDGLLKIAREFDSIPGTSSYLSSIRSVKVNDSGQVAFTSDFNGLGGGTGSALGLFLGDSSGFSRIAMYGDAVPGASDRFEVFSTPAINNHGDMAFFASTNDSQSQRGAGIFAYSSLGGLTSVIREGEGLFGSVAVTLRMATAQNSLNDSGQVAFYFELADGRRGIAVTAVPEPACAVVTGILGGGIVELVRRRRRYAAR